MNQSPDDDAELCFESLQNLYIQLSTTKEPGHVPPEVYRQIAYNSLYLLNAMPQYPKDPPP